MLPARLMLGQRPIFTLRENSGSLQKIEHSCSARIFLLHEFQKILNAKDYGARGCGHDDVEGVEVEVMLALKSMRRGRGCRGRLSEVGRFERDVVMGDSAEVALDCRRFEGLDWPGLGRRRRQQPREQDKQQQRLHHLRSGLSRRWDPSPPKSCGSSWR